MASSFRKIKKFPSVFTWVLAKLIHLIRLTYRVKIIDPYGFVNNEVPIPSVIALWHNRILFFADCAPKKIRKRFTVLISRSRDGEYVSDFIKQFDLQVVRGSSKKGGATAFRQLLDHLHKGNCALITVDGPRGPRYSVQPGAGALAMKSHLPIIPVSLNAPSKWEFKSWDRLQFPKPFSRIEVIVGQPFTIPENASVEEANQLLHDKLMEVTQD